MITSIRPIRRRLIAAAALLACPLLGVSKVHAQPAESSSQAAMRSNATVSPDGSRIAHLAPADGASRIWIGPWDETSPPTAVAGASAVVDYAWSADGRRVLFVRESDGGRTMHVVDVETGDVTDVAVGPAQRVRILRVSPRRQEEAVVGAGDASGMDVHRVNLRTGAAVRLLRKAAFEQVVVDDDLRVRVAMSLDNTAGVGLVEPTEAGGWRSVAWLPAGSSHALEPLRFSPSGDFLYAIDRVENLGDALITIDPGSGERSVIAFRPGAGVADAIFHPTLGHVQAVAFGGNPQTWRIVDRSLAQDVNYLRSLCGGSMSVVSRSADDNRWIVAYTEGTRTRCYRFDRPTRRARFLFGSTENGEGGGPIPAPAVPLD